MLLILAIDVVVAATLLITGARKGVAAALPYFLFFITLLPEECRVPLGVFELYTRRFALMLVLGLFLAQRRRRTVEALPFKKLIFAHLTWVFLSTAFSIVMLTSVKQVIAQVFEYYLLFYVVVKSVNDRQTIIKMGYGMIAAMAICSVLGLLEIYASWSVLSIFPAQLQMTYGTGDPLYSDMFDRGIRARSTFPHPIHFGAALAMAIPLAFYLLTTPDKSWRKSLFLNTSLFLMFWALYKTSSRGPWLATMFAMLMLAFAANRRVRRRLVIVAVAACAVLVLRPGILETLVNIYTATFDPHSQMGSSFEYRPVLFHTVTSTLNQDSVRAIFGFGLGSFREKGLVLQMPGFAAHRWYTCDSSFILFAYETGYVGLVLLTALLAQPALLAWRTFRRFGKLERDLSLVLLSCLATFYIVMISVAIYGWGQNGHMLWALIGMSTSYALLLKRQASEARIAKARSLDQPLATAAPANSGPLAWEGSPLNVFQEIGTRTKIIEAHGLHI